MVYSRAQMIDFDDWGTDGWRGKDMLPFLKNVREIYIHIYVLSASMFLFVDARSV